MNQNLLKKLFFPVLIFCSSTLLFTHLSFAECNNQLVIGFIAPFSGESKIFGESCKNGFELGLKSVGCSSIKVFYEDDQFVPSKTVTAFRKLTEFKKINVIIATSSPEGNAVAPLAHAKGIPLFAWAADTNVTKGHSLATRIWPNGEMEGKLLAEEILKRGYKNIALISGIDDYVLSVKEGLTKNLPAKIITANEEVPEKSNDFLTLLTKIKQKNPDGVYICSNMPGTAGIIAKQVRQLGIQSPIFGCYTLQFPINFETSQGALIDSWFDSDTIEEKFLNDYKLEYKDIPGTSGGAAIHYDLARILAMTKSPVGQSLVDEIFTLKNYTGAGMRGVKPVALLDDRFFDIDLSIKKFDKNGAVVR